jgi:antitoxin HicB
MTRLYGYRATFEPGERHGVVVSFPDIPEAVSEGADLDEARLMAGEALGLALLTYAELGRLLPPASQGPGEWTAVSAPVAAKLAVIEAFRDAGITGRELASRLGHDEREVRRILDPRHPTKLPTLTRALTALGRRLVVGVEDLAAAE